MQAHCISHLIPCLLQAGNHISQINLTFLLRLYNSFLTVRCLDNCILRRGKFHSLVRLALLLSCTLSFKLVVWKYIFSLTSNRNIKKKKKSILCFETYRIPTRMPHINCSFSHFFYPSFGTRIQNNNMIPTMHDILSVRNSASLRDGIILWCTTIVFVT